MSSLEQIRDEIKSEIKVNEKGVGYATVRGCGRLVDVQHSTLLRAFVGGKNPSKLAQMLIGQGFEVVSFSTNGIPDLAVALIAKYYAFYAGARCTKLAELADLAFGGIGVRAWFQELVGWDKSNVSKCNTNLATSDQEIEALIVAQQTTLTALLDTRRQLKETREEQFLIKTELNQIKQKQLAAEKAFTEAPLPEVVTPAMKYALKLID